MQKSIESVQYYAGGYCTHNEKAMFKNFTSKQRIFPAGIFLIKHRDHGYILYDTGYSTSLYGKGLKRKLYRAVTPLFIKEGDRIDRQLVRDGIKLSSIRYVVLSHLHPDHIGGAAYFPEATFVITKEAQETFHHPKITDLFFNDLLPNDFEQRRIILKHTEGDFQLDGFPLIDLFGDRSLFGCSIDGHAKGQLCLYIPEHQLFIGADTSWGVDLIPYAEKMKMIPKRIQSNYSAYMKGIELLRLLMNKGIKVVVSHDHQKRIEEILK